MDAQPNMAITLSQKRPAAVQTTASLTTLVSYSATIVKEVKGGHYATTCALNRGADKCMLLARSPLHKLQMQQGQFGRGHRIVAGEDLLGQKLLAIGAPQAAPSTCI